MMTIIVRGQRKDEETQACIEDKVTRMVPSRFPCNIGFLITAMVDPFFPAPPLEMICSVCTSDQEHTKQPKMVGPQRSSRPRS